jgi:hypothetical protein
MPLRSEPVTPSRFERRLPGGKHDLIFKVAFGSDGAAARVFRVSRMTIWRWRHEQAAIPKRVLDDLRGRLQTKVEEARAAQDDFDNFLKLPAKPPRPLSGCCAGLHRKTRKIPTTPEEWAALD